MLVYKLVGGCERRNKRSSGESSELNVWRSTLGPQVSMGGSRSSGRTNRSTYTTVLATISILGCV
jgi:hypothetical protein